LQRRSLLVGGAVLALGTGCATKDTTSTYTFYQETIQSIATTQDWRQIVVFGEMYDYLLTPDERLVALLQGALRPDLAAEFGSARLHRDNSVALTLRLTVAEDRLSPEQREQFKVVAPRAPGRRVLVDQALTLQRVPKLGDSARFVGARPPNAAYRILVIGEKDAVKEPTWDGWKLPVALLLLPLMILLVAKDGIPLK